MQAQAPVGHLVEYQLIPVKMVEEIEKVGAPAAGIDRRTHIQESSEMIPQALFKGATVCVLGAGPCADIPQKIADLASQIFLVDLDMTQVEKGYHLFSEHRRIAVLQRDLSGCGASIMQVIGDLLGSEAPMTVDAIIEAISSAKVVAPQSHDQFDVVISSCLQQELVRPVRQMYYAMMEEGGIEESIYRDPRIVETFDKIGRVVFSLHTRLCEQLVKPGGVVYRSMPIQRGLTDQTVELFNKSASELLRRCTKTWVYDAKRELDTHAVIHDKPLSIVGINQRNTKERFRMILRRVSEQYPKEEGMRKTVTFGLADRERVPKDFTKQLLAMLDQFPGYTVWSVGWIE